MVSAFGLYILWYILHDLWLHPYYHIDLSLIDNLNLLSSGLLELLGYDLMPQIPNHNDIRTIGIDGTHGLWIGDTCSGASLFALFTGFVIAYPGPWKRKLWFIPLGLVTIHIINVLRIVSLCLIVLQSPEYLDFNHNYTFTILVYGYVFLLWYLWALKFSKNNENQKTA